MKGPHQEDWQGRKTHAMFAGAEVSCQRHFANIEFELAYHVAKRVHEHRHFLKLKSETGRRDGAILQCGVIALCAGHGLQCRFSHVSPPYAADDGCAPDGANFPVCL